MLFVFAALALLAPAEAKAGIFSWCVDQVARVVGVPEPEQASKEGLPKGWSVVHSDGSVTVSPADGKWKWLISSPDGETDTILVDPQDLVGEVGAARAKFFGIESLGKGAAYRFPDLDRCNRFKDEFNRRVGPDSPDRMLVTFYPGSKKTPTRTVIRRFVANFEWAYTNDGALGAHDATVHSVINVLGDNRVIIHARDCLAELERFQEFMEKYHGDVTRNEAWDILQEEAGHFLDGITAPLFYKKGHWVNGFDYRASPDKLIQRLIGDTSVRRNRRGIIEKEALQRAYELYKRIRQSQGDPISTEPLVLETDLAQARERRLSVIDQMMAEAHPEH